ncbi:hypothetical protein [Rubellicoccus peritrichatus]|uniref:Uncharacterized protein n=1 Tax=Rubellicoccus peritrichatus TaxID=3080537 RepID=A0AAQ3QPR0_9BACT|nr:hypothetical protein [Puniceicoccus sp. CR14]WOO39338.1 hypothetical protein RZN69_12000 [Puniceicoccus sp. CR14]
MKAIFVSLKALLFLMLSVSLHAPLYGLGEIWRQHSDAGNGWYWVYPYGFVYPAEDTGWAFVDEYKQWIWSPSDEGTEMWFTIGEKWFWTNREYYPIVWTHFDANYTGPGVLLAYDAGTFASPFFFLDFYPLGTEFEGYPRGSSFSIEKSRYNPNADRFDSLGTGNQFPYWDPYSFLAWYQSGKEHAQNEAIARARFDVGDYGYSDGLNGHAQDPVIPATPEPRTIDPTGFPLWVAYYRYKYGFDTYWDKQYQESYEDYYNANWGEGNRERQGSDSEDVIIGIDPGIEITDGSLNVTPAGG